MEDKLHQIRVWAGHGTPRQFFVELEARLAKKGKPTEYIAEGEGSTITCYRVGKVGGFLGVGAKQTKQPVLHIVFGESDVQVPAEGADPAFVDWLVARLHQH
jgi:hypothetical protein